MKIKIWITLLAMVALGNLATAQETPSANATAPANKNINRPNFVDINKDGICDNFDSNQGRANGISRGQGLGKGNGKGNCKGRGPGQGNRSGKRGVSNFVDANNNGICDHRENTGSK